jgi:hypothetical protein
MVGVADGRWYSMRLGAPTFTTSRDAAMARRLLPQLVLVCALVAVASAATTVLAIGYWNVPGNSNQWWGYGWGAGHHACLVLGPSSCEDCLNHREVRVPYAPKPPYGAYGHCGYNYDFRQPTPYAPAGYSSESYETQPVTGQEPMPEMMAPSDPQPSPEPLPIPPEQGEPSPRPLFDAPVE